MAAHKTITIEVQKCFKTLHKRQELEAPTLEHPSPTPSETYFDSYMQSASFLMCGCQPDLWTTQCWGDEEPVEVALAPNDSEIDELIDLDDTER